MQASSARVPHAAVESVPHHAVRAMPEHCHTTGLPDRAREALGQCTDRPVLTSRLVLTPPVDHSRQTTSQKPSVTPKIGLWLISGTLVAILAVAVIALYRRVRMLSAANPT